MGAACGKDDKADDSFGSNYSRQSRIRSMGALETKEELRSNSCCGADGEEDALMCCRGAAYSLAGGEEQKEEKDGSQRSKPLIVESKLQDRGPLHEAEHGTTMHRVAGRRTSRQSVFTRVTQDEADFLVFQSKPKDLAWFTFAVSSMWPFIGAAIKKLLMGSINRLIQDACAGIPLLSSLAFTECNFGHNMPSFGPIKVSCKDDLVELMIDTSWKADGSLIDMTFGGGNFNLGLKDLELNGPVLVVISPVIGVLPIIGGLSITFPDAPEVTWTWTGIADKLGVGSLKKTIRAALVETIFSCLVIPSRIYVDIADLENAEDDDDLPNLVDCQSPPPIGILHIQVMKARGLPSADVGGTSDPYVSITVGSPSGSWRTCSVRQNLDPEWGKAHSSDFMVYHMEQHVKIDIFDEDLLTSDEILGFVSLDAQGSTAATGVKPTVTQLLQKQSHWWPVKTPDHFKKSLPQVWLKCCFRKCDEFGQVVRPLLITCDDGHELQQAFSGRGNSGAYRCSLCQEAISRGWSNLTTCAPRSEYDYGQECVQCKFRICSECYIAKRPAAGMLRIGIKQGRVPIAHATSDDCVYLGIEFENTTNWSCKSYQPSSANSALDLEQTMAVRALSKEANLEAPLIARCLKMEQSEVEGILSKSAGQGKDKDLLDVQAVVIWQHALHFLVREPKEDLRCTLLYRCGDFKMQSDVSLVGKSKVKKTNRNKLGQKVNHYDEDVFLQDFESSMTWELLDKDGKLMADIDVDVCFYGLTRPECE